MNARRFNFWKATARELTQWALLDELLVLDHQQITQGENYRARIKQVKKELRKVQ